MGLRIILCALIVLMASGCGFTRTPTQTTRTATEQLLLSQAIERSLHDLTVPIAEGSSVTMDTVAQVHSHMIAHQYEGLIKKSKLKGSKDKR